MGWGKGARCGAREKLSAAYRNNTAIRRWLLCAELTLVGGPALAGGALPAGGQYVAGQGTIAGSANALTINQSTTHGIINWQGFSIGAGNRVQFNNGSGATLNRVTGNNLSQIDGSLSATGSVYLINPQGVVIGPGGRVVTNGSFVASTRDVSNSDFMGGAAFSASGTSNGSVVNAGTITSANGDAILVGRSVKNTGSINAPNGTAVMAAGNEILLRPASGDSRIAVSGGTGDVTNAGTVKAAQAALASAGGNVYALVENNGGINATGTKTVDGHVWLTAGGSAQIAGNITATNADGSGGTVTARAQAITISGTVDASATKAGKNGGTASIIATGDTTVSGAVKAKGNAGGKGGTVETSGHTLEIGGATVDAGEGGQWLLDPYDLTVDATAASTIDASLGAGTDVTLKTTASGTSGPGTANASGNGDILVENPLSWSSSAKLTLDAYHSIDIDAPITVSGGGGVVLTTNDGSTGGDYLFAKGGTLSFTGGSGSGATLEINGAAYTLLYSMGDVQNINASDATLQGDYALATSLDAATDSTTPANWIPIGTDGFGDIGDFPNGFSGVFEGLGHTISNLTINNFNGGYLRSYAGLFGASAGTIRDVGIVGGSVTGGDSVGGLVGYNSGTVSYAYSTASVSGNAATISGLGSISSGSDVGGLVGWNEGTVHDVYATGPVTGTGSYIGGLAGTNGGGITDAYATGTVSGGASMGGLAGYNSGGVTDSNWDTDFIAPGIPGIGGGGGSATGSGLTTSQLTGSLPSGFSPSIWGNADNGSTPYLQALTSGTQPGYTGDGSNGVVQLLFTLDQVQAVNNNLSGNYALANSLDATGVNWTPIGNDSTDFTGVFDGLNHTISNLTVNVASGDAGLFGKSGGTIRNIGVAGGSITGGSEVGALLGVNYGGTVSNAWSSASVSSSTDAADVGGLVGYNDATITKSFATGSVTGTGEDAIIGGLVGWDFVGTISQSYATGAVTGGAGSYTGGLVGYGYSADLAGDYAMGSVTASGVDGGGFGPVVGGLVGYSVGSTIDQTFSIGAVSVSGANSAAGGLVGTSQSDTITNSYWDTETSGLATSAAGTGKTTAQLQGALPTGFDSSVWGTGTGLFPYFTWQYSTTPQAISGTAYSDSGVTLLKAGTVGALVDGESLGSVSTGANGYYYVLAPSGTISSGSAILAYTSNGARLDSLSASASGFDIWGNTLIAPTSATTYSGASTTSLRAQDAALLAQAIGSNSDPTTGLSQYGYIASGDFTLDDPLTLSNGLYIKSAGNITVADALTLQGSNGLTLNATGALTVDAPVSATGAGKVSLNAGIDTTTLPGISLVKLTFGAGDSIDYGATDNGGSLSINGAAYTLIYTMAQLQSINSALSNNYALATSLNAATDSTTPASWVPIGLNSSGTAQNSGNGFNGTFDGLGHTISNVSITFNHLAAGLFGYVHGKIRNVGLVGGSVTSSSQWTGGLVGELYNGTLYNSYSSANASASATAGSLVGLNYGYIARDYATGSASASGGYAGGLVGQNANQIVDSYATGSVYAGSGKAGGLVGYNSGVITDAYATGTVNGTDKVGGLVGWNNGSVSNAYATGYVHGTSNVGGLVGSNGGTVTDGYWDKDTTGQTGTSAGTGLTTAQLQGALPSGFDSSIWGTGDGLYSYFRWQYATTPEAISGTVYTDGNGMTALKGVTIDAVSGGQIAGAASSGANGYYYVLMPSGTVNSAGVLAYVAGNAVNGAMFTDEAANAVDAASRATGLDNIYGGTTTIATADSNLSTALGNLATTLGSLSNSDLGLTATPSSLIADAGITLNASASNFTVDGDLTATGEIIVKTPGTLTLASGSSMSSAASGDAIEIQTGTFINDAGSSALALTGGGRWLIYSDDPDNDVFGGLDSGNTAIWNAASLAPSSVTQSGKRYLFDVQPTLTITTTDVMKTYGDDAAADVAAAYTVSGYESGVAGAFLGDDASSVYSGAPSVTSSGSDPMADVSGSPYAIDAALGGMTLLNGYAVSFANMGALTVDPAHIVVTALGGSSTYGGSPSNPGLSATGLVNGQDVSVLAGLSNDFNILPTTDAGSYTLHVAGTNTNSNYVVDSTVDGSWVVDPAHVVVTALGGTSTYGGTSSNPGLSATGLVNGQDVSVLTGLSNDFAILLTTNAGSYTLHVAGTNTNSNYVVDSTVDGSWVVDPAHVIVTALGGASIYGDSPSNPGLSATGLVNGQDVSVLTGLSNDFAILPTTNAGSYALHVAGSNTNGNYIVDATTNGSWVVAPHALTIAANDGSKIYDGVAYAGGNGVSYAGFVNGDDASDLSGALSYGGTAQGAVNAGTYTIAASGLTSGNYVITYDPGTLTVTVRPITVTASDLARLYGAGNPALAYTVGGDGLVSGDTLSGSLGTAATAASGVGAYAIVQGSLAASANYALTFVPGTLTIDPAPLTITANDLTAPSLSAAQFSVSYAGFANGDDSSVVSGLEYGVFPIAGDPLEYDIVPFGATASNYAITFFPGLLTTVEPTPPIIHNNGYANFDIALGTNKFSFSNIATAALGSGDVVLLFEAGLPGTISPFESVAISDYSNATDSEDLLINCQDGTCSANGGTGL